MPSYGTYNPPPTWEFNAGRRAVPGALGVDVDDPSAPSVPMPMPAPADGHCPDGYWPNPIAGQCYPNPPYPQLPGQPCATGYEPDGQGWCRPGEQGGDKPTHWAWWAALGLAAAAGGALLVKTWGRR